MNEDMKVAWLEISELIGEPTREELDVFLRTWQRAMQAEREACAKVCEDAFVSVPHGKTICTNLANEIRARGQA